ncbi:hypothetical protein GMOD_00008249 [Pyrenophora seminiperda CCB06]|uniref:Uncharacterized protein n=1 Tax=Pyrenophora seminiperda CCB06 TaxID=1302712 RepID=A0A3M7M265_9PLEO|nr:hypothetical protein GMOD_00008249 [Pyrenophora seminiperda CCB06]
MPPTNEPSLRLLTLSAAALTTPFLIATTIVSVTHQNTHVTAFCFGFIPLATTAFASAIALYYQRFHGRLPSPGLALLDGVACCFYFAVLVPVWVVEVGRLGQVGLGLLAGYTTAPMVGNMLIHFYIFALKFRAMWAVLWSPTMHECPNCHNEYMVGVGGKTQVKETCVGGERYSLLRGEEYLDADADAEVYVEGESARASMEEGVVEGQGEGEKGEGEGSFGCLRGWG